MRPHARFLAPDGRSELLGPGDIIGRMPTATLNINDPHLSEAHALVSLRGSELKLLGLRGRFSVLGKPRTEVTLRAGLRIVLAGQVALVVQEIVLPAEVLALVGPSIPQQVLDGVVSVRAGVHLELVKGIAGDAAIVLWSVGDNFFCRSADGPARLVCPGDTWRIGDHQLAAVLVPIGQAERAATVRPGDTQEPLHLFFYYDTVHIHRTGVPTLVFDGISARLLSELMLVAVPIGWHSVARELWPEEGEPAALRRRWDASLGRLRAKLRDGDVRQDLVRSSGVGNVELLLGPSDIVEDRT